MLQFWPHYKCYEIKAARDYVNRYPLGYSGAELWGIWIYEPSIFIEARTKNYIKENRLKIKYLAYQDVDPCNPYQYDNSCYAPLFSKIADESSNMSFWKEALYTASVLNLDLSVCEFASIKERELGLNSARRHIKTLKKNFPVSNELRKVSKFMLLRETNEYHRTQKYSDSCRHHNDN